MTLDFIFRLVHCMLHSPLFSECVGRHQAVLLVNVVQETRLETSFKGDNVKNISKNVKL